VQEDDPERQSGKEQPTSLLFPAGILIAFVGALCGIGGGLFAVPLLHFWYRRSLQQSVATSLVLVLMTAASATWAEALRGSPDIVWALVPPLALGMLIGAQIGYAISRRIDPKILREVFAVVLFLAGLRLVLSGGHSGDAGTPVEIVNLTLGTVCAIGVGGGILAPLLGVGGGLLMVPALFLSVPCLGFAGARACSLAAAVVGASRSLWLHSRDAHTCRRDAIKLGSGALLGAALGVLALHASPSMGGLGQTLLAFVLWFTAFRFLREALRGRFGSNQA